MAFQRTVARMLLVVLALLWCPHIMAETPKDIVQKADQLLRANSSISELSMTVIKPDWSRTMNMKVWAVEPDYALVLVTSPAKDKGTVTLKRQIEVWNWIPAVQRVIKIPPSMMLQPWMGSDFTNDDLVRESSIVVDYEHSIIAEEQYAGYDCYQIQMIPKPEAGVVWGKIITWISKESYLQLKEDFYDEEGILVKSMIGSKVQEMGGRTIPTHWEMTPLDKPNQKTVMEYLAIEFNPQIETSFFSEQNMKRVR